MPKYPQSFSKDLTLIDDKSLTRDKLRITPQVDLVGPSEIINNQIDIYSKTEIAEFSVSVEKGDFEKAIIIRSAHKKQ